MYIIIFNSHSNYWKSHFTGEKTEEQESWITMGHIVSKCQSQDSTQGCWAWMPESQPPCLMYSESPAHPVCATVAHPQFPHVQVALEKAREGRNCAEGAGSFLWSHQSKVCILPPPLTLQCLVRLEVGLKFLKSPQMCSCRPEAICRA